MTDGGGVSTEARSNFPNVANPAPGHLEQAERALDQLEPFEPKSA